MIIAEVSGPYFFSRPLRVEKTMYMGNLPSARIVPLESANSRSLSICRSASADSGPFALPAELSSPLLSCEPDEKTGGPAGSWFQPRAPLTAAGTRTSMWLCSTSGHRFWYWWFSPQRRRATWPVTSLEAALWSIPTPWLDCPPLMRASARIKVQAILSGHFSW